VTTTLEVLLTREFGGSIAKKALERLSKRSFPGKLVSRVPRRQGLEPSLTPRERWRIRRLVRDRDTWELLVNPHGSSIEALAIEVDQRVFGVQGGSASVSQRALDVAAAVKAELPGALDLQDALVLVSSQVGTLDDSLSTMHTAVNRVGSDVQSIAEALGHRNLAEEADVFLRGPLDALGLTPSHARAQEVAGTDPVAAAKLLGEISDRLDAEGYGGLGRPLRLQRAQLLTRAGEAVAAASAWMPLLIGELVDGAGTVCREAVAAFRQLALVRDAPSWLAARADAVELAHHGFAILGRRQQT
jgi:hypothetical protein